MDWLVKYWAPIWAAITTVAIVVMALVGKTFVKRDEHTTLEQRVAAVEQTVEDLPSVDELHQLNLEISELRGDLKALQPQLQGVQRISNLLLENELNGGKRDA